MATPVIMPRLGPAMDEGTVVQWFKQQGEQVKKGEPLLEVITDKVNVEVESPAEGTLQGVSARTNDTVPVGEIIGYILSSGESLPLAATGAAQAMPTIDRANAVQSVGERRVIVSPLARRLAKEAGIDLHGLHGSGPKGRILAADVLATATQKPTETTAIVPRAQAAPPAPQPTSAAPDNRAAALRSVIAKRMQESHQITAPVTLTTEADATAFVALREQMRTEMAAELGFDLGYNDLFVKVAARALREFSYMNGRLDDGISRHVDNINVGLAVDSERGLIVPVIRQADRKGVADIARELRQLVERARGARLQPDDLAGGTFTITNLGMYEVDAFTPIINLPETAILGVGQIKARPAVVDDQVCVRQMIWLSLTFDHRLVDGAPAARFLQRVKRLVEKPFLLLA